MVTTRVWSFIDEALALCGLRRSSQFRVRPEEMAIDDGEQWRGLQHRADPPEPGGPGAVILLSKDETEFHEWKPSA